MSRCVAITKRGTPCRNQQYPGSIRCNAHMKQLRSKKMPYGKYLASKEWKAKRQEFMDSPLTSIDCYCCGRKYEPGFNLHHVTYERIGKERLSDLKMVCKPCHKEIHLVAKKIKPLKKATEAVRLRKKMLKSRHDSRRT